MDLLCLLPNRLLQQSEGSRLNSTLFFFFCKLLQGVGLNCWFLCLLGYFVFAYMFAFEIAREKKPRGGNGEGQ